MPLTRRRAALLFGMLSLGVIGSLGGCEFKCACDDKGSVEKAIDEVGDEVEDVVDKVKEKKP